MVGQELCHYLGTVGMGQVGYSLCILPSINTNWDHFEYGKPLFADHLLVFMPHFICHLTAIKKVNPIDRFI